MPEKKSYLEPWLKFVPIIYANVKLGFLDSLKRALSHDNTITSYLVGDMSKI